MGADWYLQGVEELAQAVTGTLVLLGPYGEHSLGPELPQHCHGAVNALRIKVVHRVGPGGAHKVHGGVGLHHLAHCSPEATAESGL